MQVVLCGVDSVEVLDAPFEPVGRGGVPLDQLIEDQVAELHGNVDEVLHRMQETDEWKGPSPPKREERKSPLTPLVHVRLG